MVCLYFLLFVIVSCTIMLDRVEKSGTLVNFSIGKTENSFSYRNFRHYNKSLHLLAMSFKARFTRMAFFIFFIPWKEEEKLLSITTSLIY